MWTSLCLPELGFGVVEADVAGVGRYWEGHLDEG